MPKIVSITDHRSFCRIKASPKFSVEFLQVDLRRDTISLFLELLRGICDDYTHSLDRDLSTSVSDSTDRPVSPSGPSLFHHLTISRLNVLVLLSKKIFVILHAHTNLRPAVLNAIYNVLRLVIWSYNRSVRCAGLRCLCYYLHTCSDVRLFLESQLDLVVARCLDLSYVPERATHLSHQPVPSRHLNAQTSNPGLRSRLPALSSADGSCLPRNSSHDLPTNQPRLRTRRSINPRLCTLRSSQSPSSQTNGTVLDSVIATNIRSTGHLPASPLVSAVGERQLFLRVAYRLVRLAPHLFPSSLIQAVAAPCLRAARFQASGGGTTESKANKRDPKPTVHFAFRFQQPGLPAATAAGRTDKANPEGTDSMVQDVALRSCLLIITELIILAPEHIQNLASSSWGVCSESSEPSQEPDSSQRHSSLLPSDSVDHVAVQALMSTFAASLHVNTIHSSRIHEAVLLGLLSLMNVAGTIALVPSRRIAKFFVPFTSMLEHASQPRPIFDSHPSFTDCAKLCLTTMLRSWSGLFYFLHEGLPCLQTLMYSLAVGTTEMRNQILDFLSGLFPSLPTLHPSITHLKAAVLGLSEALARCAPCILPAVCTYPTQTNNSVGVGNQRSHISFTQSLRNSEVGDSKSTPDTYTRSSYVPPSRSAWDLDGGFVAAEGCRIFFKYGSNTGDTIDLIETYTALLLTTLIQAGLYEGLIRAISDPDEGTSVRAGLLFGLLAYKACSLLPHEHPAARRLHHVGLLQPKICGSQLAVMWLERVHRIMYTHEIQLIDPASFIRAPLHSPFLECLARQRGSTDLRTVDGVTGTPTPNGFQSPETWVDHIAVQSGIISILPTRQPGATSSRSTHGQPVCEVTKDPNSWDWDTLASFGRSLFDLHSMFSWEDKSRMRFLHCLMEFLTPNVELSPDAHPTSSSKICSAPISFTESNILLNDSIAFRFPAKGKDLTHFIRTARSSSTVTNTFLSSPAAHTSNCGCCLNLAWLPHTWPHASKAALLAAGLIPHLAVYPTTSEPGQLLTKFLLAIRDALVSLHGPVKDAVGGNGSPQLSLLFQPNQLSTSCSGLLILAIGRLTCTEVGESRLESVGLYSVFHQLLFSSKLLTSGSSTELVRKHDLGLLKLLLSSLDFTRPGRLGHQLLTATVNGGRKSARIYLVQFIRLLFRLRLPFLASWCVDLIVKLCLDPCPQISRSALHLLEETCWDTVNVQAITRHILTDPNPPPSSSPTSNPAGTCLTPFGLRLLDPSTGPVGHRIFARLLSSNASFRSLLPTLDSKSSPASQPSANVIYPLDKTAVKDAPNSTLSDSGFLQTPLEWMLDMARRRYNLAYAAEIDNRLNRLFIGHAPGRDQMITDKYIDDTVSRRFPRFKLNGRACHRESADNSQPMITARSSEGEVEGESDTSAEFDQNRPSNRESSPHYQRDRADACSVYYDTLRCLPLPKHLYGCLAEHPAGLDLLTERGDLQTALDVLNVSSNVYLPRSTSPPPDAPSILATKAALWALAHVGSATSGQLWFTRQQPELAVLFQRFATEATSMGLRA
ncbi:hypothetical protein P879_00540 [Paragonimus westermani]|uniref:Uncharacterized protein n=1 Tax=Paragonimus westermani TaxID=34504 RepID=A0A8T0DQ71_9TREM|nr:hypothetical protein P879_00540 [Paragonimus westermani]